MSDSFVAFYELLMKVYMWIAGYDIPAPTIKGTTDELNVLSWHFWEKIYEPAIRSAAGLGKLEQKADPSTYDKGFLHCDLLVIGGGPAGVLCGSILQQNGADVLLLERAPGSPLHPALRN